MYPIGMNLLSILYSDTSLQASGLTVKALIAIPDSCLCTRCAYDSAKCNCISPLEVLLHWAPFSMNIHRRHKRLSHSPHRCSSMDREGDKHPPQEEPGSIRVCVVAWSTCVVRRNSEHQRTAIAHDMKCSCPGKLRNVSQYFASTMPSYRIVDKHNRNNNLAAFPKMRHFCIQKNLAQLNTAVVPRHSCDFALSHLCWRYLPL